MRIEPGDAAIGPTPAGFRYFRRSITLAMSLGPGDSSADRAFERARAMLRAWAPQIGGGMRVEIDGAEGPLLPAPAEGMTGRLTTRVCGVIPLRAPLRVVSVMDGADAAGYAYETLPGHPEEGREAFFVTRGAGVVEFTVTAYSRPVAWYSRLGGPVTRRIQDIYTNKYLQAMAVRPR